MRRDVDGILLLDKPVGLSSNQALQRVKRLYRARKAGHTGSLDPLATGMLPICLGEATKVSAFLLDSDKCYRFGVRFGVRTSTGDREGIPVATGADSVGEPELHRAVASLRGALLQVPPMYSALKQGGQPLYALARAGQTVERAPREVVIRSFEVEVFDPHCPVLRVQCSKGTYVRALAEDLAAALGTVGHVADLRRLWVAPFRETGMLGLEVLEGAAQQALADADALLLPMDQAVSGYPQVRLNAADTARLRHGQAVHGPTEPRTDGLRRLYDPEGAFIGMGERRPDGLIVPRRLLAERAGRNEVNSGL